MNDDIRQLVEDLGKIPAKALKGLDAIVQRGALNVKNEMRADAGASVHFKGMAGSITYESHYRIGQVRYVIGPDKSISGGALGNIYYFGTSRGGGSGDIGKALRSEQPRFFKALQDGAIEWAQL